MEKQINAIVTTLPAMKESCQVALDIDPSIQNITDLVPAAFLAIRVIRLVTAEKK